MLVNVSILREYSYQFYDFFSQFRPSVCLSIFSPISRSVRFLLILNIRSNHYAYLNQTWHIALLRTEKSFFVSLISVFFFLKKKIQSLKKNALKTHFTLWSTSGKKVEYLNRHFFLKIFKNFFLKNHLIRKL